MVGVVGYAVVNEDSSSSAKLELRRVVNVVLVGRGVDMVEWKVVVNTGSSSSETLLELGRGVDVVE